MDTYAQMRPSSKPTWRTAGDFMQNTKASNFGLDDGGCPSGTVPIGRVSDGDRIQAQMLSNTYASRARPLSTGPKPGTHVSVISIPIIWDLDMSQLGCFMYEHSKALL